MCECVPGVEIENVLKHSVYCDADSEPFQLVLVTISNYNRSQKLGRGLIVLDVAGTCIWQ